METSAFERRRDKTRGGQAGYAGVVDREARLVMRGPSVNSRKRRHVKLPTAPTVAQLREFFAAIEPSMSFTGTNTAGAAVGKTEVADFFTTIQARVKSAERKQRRIDKRSATGFNVFRLIGPDENKLSDILADLLDPGGTHGQGDLFLRLLFERVGLGSGAKLTKNATVQREAPTHGILKYRRRMDVFVDAGALLVIENKQDASEQLDQVKDYLAHVDTCLRGRKSRLIYLTRNGERPRSLSQDAIERERASERLHLWSYQGDLRDWLEECRRQCKAKRISDFLLDFMRHIDSEMKPDFTADNLEDIDED